MFFGFDKNYFEKQTQQLPNIFSEMLIKNWEGDKRRAGKTQK